MFKADVFTIGDERLVGRGASNRVWGGCGGEDLRRGGRAGSPAGCQNEGGEQYPEEETGTLHKVIISNLAWLCPGIPLLEWALNALPEWGFSFFTDCFPLTELLLKFHSNVG